MILLQDKLVRHISKLFTVIPILWLVSELVLQAHFDVICSDLALAADIRTGQASTGGTFRRIYGDPTPVSG